VVELDRLPGVLVAPQALSRLDTNRDQHSDAFNSALAYSFVNGSTGGSLYGGAGTPCMGSGASNSALAQSKNAERVAQTLRMVLGDSGCSLPKRVTPHRPDHIQGTESQASC
jgi:hypothetical protein